MRISSVLSILAFALPALLSAQPPLDLIPRGLTELPGAPVPLAAEGLLSRSALAESSPFAAITATDPLLGGEASDCRPGIVNDVSAERMEPCAGLTPAFYSRFVDGPAPRPLSPAQKAQLAARNVVQPGNLATLGGSSAYTILTNSHTAYGPGFTGLGRSFGYGLVQDATGQFFGTWAIPALAGEDSRYHRMPHAGIGRRVFHAVSHTVVSQHDDGRPMPNYSTLGTYAISAEISNLYVPGVHGDGPSTVARILTGYATDPIDNLITEFLPDVARHVQVHVLFMQQVLNQISADPAAQVAPSGR